MVAVREGHLIGSFDLELWATKFGLETPQIKKFKSLYLTIEALAIEKDNIPLLAKAREMAEILQDMHMDLDTLRAALIYPWYEQSLLDDDTICEVASKKVLVLLKNVSEMAAIQSLHGKGRNLSGGQVDNLRRMLMAMVQDVRAVVIKLAERVAYLREIKNEAEEVRVLAAREIADIYAPLANRLGIGQLKWELEDISFRYLHPDTYKRIASLLDQKRLERENYIDKFVAQFQTGLSEQGINGKAYGRPKHIYSIWKKMDQKSLSFDKLFDVRAIRVVVNELEECYAALGILHSIWQHVPSEFSDYVANPKPNGYQSIHSIVIGPEERTIEVQIRTKDMHEDAEMGVAAHWRYKEGVGATKDSNFEGKIEWLRKVLAWQDDVKGSGKLADEVRDQVFDDRIYVYTPNGDVVDMPNGCTPLDFAYYVHSQVGHRCIGAKINDKIVPFTTKLETGQQVEILTAKEPNPKRDWLNPRLGYVFSPRSRSKIQHFFKQQDKDKHIIAGREILEDELSKLGLKFSDVQVAVRKYNYNTIDDLCAAVGCGDVRINSLMNFLQLHYQSHIEEPVVTLKKHTLSNHKSKSEVVVEGVGNLLTHMAKCCRPIPGDKIDGFITQGKGVSVHRKDCGQLKESLLRHPERHVDVHWGNESSSGYSLEITVFANDRTGLMRDITSIIANDKVNMIGMNTKTDEPTQIANISLTVEVADQEVLARLLTKLSGVEGVFDVQRR